MVHFIAMHVAMKREGGISLHYHVFTITSVTLEIVLVP